MIALLFVVLNLSMLVASLAFGALLTGFDQMSVAESNQRLIGVLQGAALVAVALNLIALWKQESINRERAEQIKADRQAQKEQPGFAETWAKFIQAGSAARLLVALGLGTAGFQMQDILLEPYGGQVLGLTVVSDHAPDRNLGLRHPSRLRPFGLPAWASCRLLPNLGRRCVDRRAGLRRRDRG